LKLVDYSLRTTRRILSYTVVDYSVIEEIARKLPYFSPSPHAWLCLASNKTKRIPNNYVPVHTNGPLDNWFHKWKWAERQEINSSKVGLKSNSEKTSSTIARSELERNELVGWLGRRFVIWEAPGFIQSFDWNLSMIASHSAWQKATWSDPWWSLLWFPVAIYWDAEC